MKNFAQYQSVRKAMLRVLFAAILPFFLVSSASAKPLIVEKGVIQCDTTWANEVFVKGDVEVAQGVTLTVMPGTVVKFAKIEDNGPANLYMDKTKNFTRAELVVSGRIIAQGTKDKMIVFTSAEKSPHVADWGAINMLDRENNILEYCDISYAHTSVHSHGAQFTLANSYLHDNGVAVGFKNVDECKPRCVNILYNRISNNGGGVLSSKDSIATISHNEISHNKFFGVYGKKATCVSVRYNNIVNNGKGIILWATEGFRISENNISDNEDYNVSLLEGQVWDVDVRNNWWGITDRKEIRKLMWDKEQDATLGRIDFSHHSLSPIEGGGILDE